MDFLRQIDTLRRVLIAVAVGLLVASCVLDFTTGFWTEHAFMASAIAGVLLLALTVIAIDEYVNYSSTRRWAGVAAFALEDLGRVSRGVFVRHASFVLPRLEPIGIVQYKQQLRSAEGRRQHAEQLDDIVGSVHRRKQLYDVLHETAEATRDLLIRWAPVMVLRGPLADQLSDFVRLHRLLVQVLGFLHRERAGHQLPITPQELAQKVEVVTVLAMELDDRFFQTADEIAALYPRG